MIQISTILASGALARTHVALGSCLKFVLSKRRRQNEPHQSCPVNFVYGTVRPANLPFCEFGIINNPAHLNPSIDLNSVSIPTTSAN